MTQTKLELRTNDLTIEHKDHDNDLLVKGYVNKTGQWSKPIRGAKNFRERIMAGAFQRSLDTNSEVWLYAEHDDKKMLAGTRNGSLSLSEDDTGLYMEARISPTSFGKDYHTLIKDGLITNMSFGFRVNEDEWGFGEDGLHERSVTDLTLTEVSIVKSPAYEQSEIHARSDEQTSDGRFFLCPKPICGGNQYV